MKALLLVPPCVRYLAGPLAGPAALAGLDPEVAVLDFNARFLAGFVRDRAGSAVVGDHAKPRAGLDEAARALRAIIEPLLGPSPAPHVAGEEAYGALWYSHAKVVAAARALADTALGATWERELDVERPRFVGLSVMFAGQVVAALALAVLVRRRWPGVPVIMGGAHVTALGSWIAEDQAYGELVDGFVAGYAEATFRELLDGPPLAARGVFRAGGGLAPRALDQPGLPRFTDLERYGIPRLTLPAQTSRGCAFGRCAFCTYPAQEGRYRATDLDLVTPVIGLAVRLGADVAFKDAFLLPDRLRRLGALIGGAVEWSGCTRLVPRLGRSTLQAIDGGGCRTLEIGVESLDAETLRTLAKRQQRADLEALLDDAAGTRVHLVLNMMFGFPGQSAGQAEAQVRWLDERCRGARVSTERNLLQIPRHSPIGRDPGRYGVTVLGTWPWSSSVAWNAPEWRRELASVLTGHHEEAA